MRKEFWKDWFRPENKKVRNTAILVLLVGCFLLLTGDLFSPKNQNQTEVTHTTYTTQAEPSRDSQTEERMAEVLSQIAGAGQVEVMLTYSKTEEKTVATQELREESRNEADGSETLRTESEIVLLEDGKGSTSPLILSADAAKVEGVVIVAQGGTDPEVCAALNHAAQALLDVPAHKIAVLKMK